MRHHSFIVMRFLLFLLTQSLNNVFSEDIGSYKNPDHPFNISFILCKDCNNFVCKGFKRCYQNPSSTCYAQWKSEDAGNIEIQNAGCYVGDFFCDDHCKAKAAYNVKPSFKVENESAPTKTSRGFCCCPKDKCNEIVITSQDESDIKPRTFFTKKESEILSRILLAIALSLLIMFIIFACVLIARKSKWRSKKELESHQIDIQGALHSNETFCLSEFKVEEIFFIQLIDSQSCGKLYTCCYNESIISIKLLTKTLDELNFLMLKNWKALNHKNIVRLMTVINLEEDKNTRTQIMMQTMIDDTQKQQLNLAFMLSCRIESTLTNYLTNSQINFEQSLCILKDILSGIKYLHASFDSNCRWKDQIVHTNLKTSSILQKLDGTFCIADLEGSICFSNNQEWCHSELRLIDISLYTAPEILNGCIMRSRDALLAIDIYSFSLIMWEVMNKCSEFSESTYKQAFSLNETQFDLREYLREKICEKGERPELSSSWFANESMTALIETMKECWEEEYYLRPTAANLLGRMKRMHLNSS